MKLTLDSKACEANGLTLGEFLILYINAKGINVQETTNSIIEKNLAGKDLFNPDTLILGSKTRTLLDKIILDSDKTVQNNTERIKNLAKTLQEIYIPGKKEGTQDYFRGGSAEIVQKLKHFFAEYGEYTDEEIIEATKKYVASFNGNYRFAQLLKYFISKKVDGEKGSRLLAYIENLKQPEVQDTQQQIDWDVELK